MLHYLYINGTILVQIHFKLFSDLQTTFDKIDRLEIMVTRIKSDMDKVERQLIQAENTLPVDPTLQPLRAFIKPAFIFVSYYFSY